MSSSRIRCHSTDDRFLIAVMDVVLMQAEAHNVLSTLASASEGYPFVPPSWAPSVFVPLSCLVLPAIAMASLFVYIEKEAPSSSN